MKNSHSHRMGRIAALACVTVLAVLTQGCTRNPNVRKVKYLNSGKAYEAQGKDKEAIIQFSNAIKIDPHYADAHFELAKAYLKTGSPMGAYAELRRTVDLDPKNVDARLELGQIYLAGHAYPKSLEQANAILAIDPKNADAWGLKSAIAMANNDHPEALKDIQQALTYAPNRAGFHAQLGLIQGTDPSTANNGEEQVREAVKLDPKNGAAHLLLASMLEKKGDTAGAEAEAQSATQIEPKNVRAWMMLAALYFQHGDKPKAESTLMQATDNLHDTTEGASLLFNFYRQTGQFDRAPGTYEQLVNKYPKSVPIKMVYAEILVDQGNFAKVQQIVDDLNKNKSTAADPQVQAMTGMLLLRSGKANDALTLLQNAVKNSPDNLVLKYWLAQTDRVKGDLPGAEENLRTVTQAQPNNFRAQQDLAQLAAQTHDNALLEQVANTMITRFPNSSEGYLWRGVAEAAENQPEKADADLQSAIQKNPKDSAALVALAEMRFREKRNPEGVQLAQQALDANPNQLPALQLLETYYMLQHQPDKALALVQQEITKSPNNSALYDQLSDLQLATKDVNGAVNSSQKAMQLNPSDGDAVMAYTRATTASGNSSAAIVKWQQWNGAHPNDPRGEIILGTLEEGRGNKSGAEDDYKKALVIQPDNATAQNNLAYLMLSNNEDVDVALSLAQSARRTMPHSPSTADTLAWAYYHKGIYESARTLLEDAAKTNPNDASIQYHLGMVYSKMGKKTDAADHLKKAVSLAPGTQTSTDATKALGTL
ncbi:MAG TPA: tetratricopeptide repeat protein [Acidobacteriaceae bacterium]|nr:tetratricopeptide repeat protein [Acidobacteriaceae bacterium]